MTITLKAGFGYKVNQDFWRLDTDTAAELVARQGGHIYVKLPESCKFARQGNARFPVQADASWKSEID